MIEFWWSVALASLGVIIPGIAAIYEFGVKGRKRLGYRVQMETTAKDVVNTPFRGALGDLRKDGVPLTDPTLVLLRIENAGSTDISETDYAAPEKSRAGITVRFADRKVVGMVVTELSDKHLKAYFEDWDGLTVAGDTIELPRVQLNKGCHYKVLTVLARSDTTTVPFGQSMIALVGLLAVIVIAQLAIFVRSDRGAPLDCASGRLTVLGSTAFHPVVREAAESYRDICPGAAFAFDMRGSGEGLLGGRDLPVRLVSRNPGSGTRAAFQRRVLGGQREPGTNSDDCRTRDPGTAPGVVRCARDSTDTVLNAVAGTPGAIGYTELGAAAARDDLAPVRINGHPATVPGADEGTYPFWETEFGYSWGEPPAGSLAASFLRYLTNQVGADIIRAHGDRPCAELANPQLCRPT